jgi:hypothetical protein
LPDNKITPDTAGFKSISVGILQERRKMNRRQILILTIGLLLCLLWVDVITPRLYSGGHEELAINSKVVAVWVIGWFVIMGLTLLKLKFPRK